MQTPANIVTLIYQSLVKELSETERHSLEEWINASPENRTFFDQFTSNQRLQERLLHYYEATDPASGRVVHEKIYMALHSENRKQSIYVRATSFLRKGRWAAAVIVLLLGTAFLWIRNSEQQTSVNASKPLAVDVQPGKEGAILTLADGSELLLDTLQNGVVAMQGGAIVKVINGELVYEGAANEVFYNTTTTPKGRQYNLMLPDGSKVWLNAASSIRYPTAFAGKERQVEVSGEVYFEVARNTKQPFKVNISGKAEVEVLGTHFNVNAYDNEQNIQTTLLEGSVRVTSSGSGKVVLTPGQQAQVSDGGTVKVIKKVNSDQVIAWKSGVFNLNGLTLQEVMRQVERWYDIEVVYEKGIPDITFGGEMGRAVSLNDLLTFMEGSKVHFRIEGKRLIVMP